MLGIPVGHVEFVQAQLVSTTKKHATLYQRIQSVQDLQSAWLLLLFCVNTRATYSLRGIPPNEVAEFAAAHDEASWQCLKFVGPSQGHRQTQCRQSVMRMWVAELMEDTCASTLGQLGGQPANDPSAAQGGGRHDDPESV